MLNTAGRPTRLTLNKLVHTETWTVLLYVITQIKQFITQSLFAGPLVFDPSELHCLLVEPFLLYFVDTGRRDLCTRVTNKWNQCFSSSSEESAFTPIAKFTYYTIQNLIYFQFLNFTL